MYICVYVYKYPYTHTYTYMRIRMRIRMHISVYVDTYPCTCTHISIRLHMQMVTGRQHVQQTVLLPPRIEAAGGFVEPTQGRVDGNLNLSRALGDFALKARGDLCQAEQRVSCEPEITVTALVGTAAVGCPWMSLVVFFFFVVYCFLYLYCIFCFL